MSALRELADLIRQGRAAPDGAIRQSVESLFGERYPKAIANDILYVIEANPRASRTVPFVSKATAVPLAKAAARVMLGTSIADLRAEGMLPR